MSSGFLRSSGGSALLAFLAALSMASLIADYIRCRSGLLPVDVIGIYGVVIFMCRRTGFFIPLIADTFMSDDSPSPANVRYLSSVLLPSDRHPTDRD